jgi:tetratricopeptide (TPR) repeat protein
VQRGSRRSYLTLAICCLLLLAVGLIFGQTIRHEFVNYDDPAYVYENPHVTHGLTASGIAWVFSHRHGANWHPLTGLSHLMDCQVHGLGAGGHHGTNVLLHAVTAIALFLVLWRMTGGFWPSALVAAVFAVHPLRAESVAWVAERKDVLSGFCFVLTLGTYVWYVRSAFSLKRYLLLILVFALGLMAKPMLVTAPLVLLLLDYWPLGRFAGSPDLAPTPPNSQTPASQSVPGRFAFPRQVVIEKLPLLLLAAASCAVTLWAQGEALQPNERLPFLWRMANALVAYVAYLGQFFCPIGLAVFYPHPGTHLSLVKVVAAAALLVGVSAGTVAYRRRCPYLLIGWLWYLGMLLPVIGLVQVGSQAMADRYTYLPQIGLCIALAWAAADACRGWPYRRGACSVASTVVLVALMACGWRQTCFWHDSETLWTHALACTSQNYAAHNNLGNALASRGRYDEAMAHYGQALKIKPGDAEAQNNLGGSLASQGRFDEAIGHYRKALEAKPNFAEVYKNLGFISTQRGRLREAMGYYRKAIEIKPDFAEAYGNMGVVLAAAGRLDAAVAQYQKALEIKPSYPDAYSNLGLVFQARGKVDEAMRCFERALELKPDFVEAHSNLGMALAGQGRLDEAMAEYQTALKIKPDYLEARNNLGYALASRGRFAEATSQYRKALKINPNHAMIHCNLANALAAQGRLDEAIIHYRKTLEIQPADVLAGYNLGNALARCGRVNEAVACYRKLLVLAEQQNNRALADAIRARIAQCQAGKTPTK